MAVELQNSDEERLRQVIISKCVWSDTYSSLKQILQNKGNRLPLLVAFTGSHNQNTVSNNTADQTILFFDRNVTKKNLFLPLKQSDDQTDQFEIHPTNYIFALTDSFKGIFEFVRNGQRRTHIYTYLEQLISYAASIACNPTFMSRYPIRVYCIESNTWNWISKEYPQGSIFQGKRIHHSSNTDRSTETNTNDYLECIDEEGYTVFLQLRRPGRFSLISSLINHQDDQADQFLYSTVTTNISQLIKYLKYDKNKNKSSSYLRLVRGSVPHNFLCQHFKFISQHKYDVLVGLTQQGLVIEWNLESDAPCRFATNLDDVLNQLYGTWDNQTLQTYMDAARAHYRENFSINIQIISSRDCTAFLQYWIWTNDLHHSNKNKNDKNHQNDDQFDLVASIQDLSDDFEVLSSECLKVKNHHKHIFQSKREIQNEGKSSVKHDSLLRERSKSSKLEINRKQKRILFPKLNLKNCLVTTREKPFDDSIYDSNRNHQLKIKRQQN